MSPALLATTFLTLAAADVPPSPPPNDPFIAEPLPGTTRPPKVLKREIEVASPLYGTRGWDFEWPRWLLPMSVDWAEGHATHGTHWRVAGVAESPADLFTRFQSLAWEPALVETSGGHAGLAAITAGVVLRDWGRASFVQPARPGLRWHTGHLVEIGLRVHNSGILAFLGIDMIAEVTWTANRRATPEAMAGASASELAIANAGKRTVYPPMFVRLEIGLGFVLVNARIAVSFAEGGMTVTTASVGIPLTAIWTSQ
jgi:hypothetical protein